MEANLMKGKIGCPAHIVTRFPHLRSLLRMRPVSLSRGAKFRLKVFDWYYERSSRYSAEGKPNASVTCRHFGIQRSYFYRWLARYNKKDLRSLECESRAPKKRRGPQYSRKLVKEVRKIREKNPTYSARKVWKILLRTYRKGFVPSIATIGRLIKREGLFFRADVEKRKKRSRAALAAHDRKRKPFGLKALKARQIIEFDMKHIYLLGLKLYAFCAIDVFTKEAVVTIASSSSSRNALKCIKLAIARFGTKITFVNDNGSENMKDVEEYLKKHKMRQYWARPHRPKDKPCVERFIGTLQREFLDYQYDAMGVADLQFAVNQWLDKYHFYRPHDSLALLTPAEYCATLGLSIPHLSALSYML
jgi:transposase InsO family protein